MSSEKVRRVLKWGRNAMEGVRASLAVAGKERVVPAGVRLNCDLNNGCNLRCVMCGIQPQSYRCMELAPFRDRFVKGFAEVDSFQLGCQYEPLMVPYYEEAVHLIAARIRPGVKGRSVSNGALLTEKKAAAMVDSDIFDNLTFSIDACSADLYEKIRRGARFDRFCSNVAALVRYRNSQKSGSRISFNFTVMPANVDELPGLIELAAEMGVDAVSTHKLHPDDYAVLERPYYDRIQRNLQMAADRAQRLGLAFTPDTSYLTGSAVSAAAKEREVAGEGRCDCVDNTITLRSESSGDLYASCVPVRAPLGNLLKEDLSAIVAGDRFQYLLHNFKRARGATCATCPRFARV